MKSVIFFILLLAFINVQAKKKKLKHDPVEKDNIITGFRVPVFAMRFPVFGGQELEDNMKPSELTFNDGKDVKLKTKTKTSNSTKGPYKTYTVTSVTTSGNKSNPNVFEKVIKSVTTLDKNSTGENITLPQIRETQFRIFRPFSFLGGFKGFNDESPKEPECSDKKPCAAEQYCDKYFSVCKKQVGKGKACSQRDQCSKKPGNLQCTWGTCIVNSDVGGLGMFCDEQKDCVASSGAQELGCFSQDDISRYSKVCIAKLQEGATCGKRRLFDMFEDENDEDSELCHSSLVCRAVGFFGRKICQKAADKSVGDYHRIVKKSKHNKHHKQHD